MPPTLFRRTQKESHISFSNLGFVKIFVTFFNVLNCILGKHLVALRRVGWKIMAHGEGVAGEENWDGIRRCMMVHFCLLGVIFYQGSTTSEGCKSIDILEISPSLSLIMFSI